MDGLRNKVNAACALKGIKKKNLIKRMGISSQFWWAVETGKRPLPRKRLLQLSKILNLPVTFFDGAHYE